MLFGISPAPEEFHRRMAEALEELDGVKVIHDDILLYAVGNSDDEAGIDHDKKLLAFLQRWQEKKIKLHLGTLKLRLKEVGFFALTVG